MLKQKPSEQRFWLVKNLSSKHKTTEIYFIYFTFSLKKYGKNTLLSSQSNCSYTSVLMISTSYRTVPCAILLIFNELLMFCKLI